MPRIILCLYVAVDACLAANDLFALPLFILCKIYAETYRLHKRNTTACKVSRIYLKQSTNRIFFL